MPLHGQQGNEETGWRLRWNGKDNIRIDDNDWDKDMDMVTRLHV